MLFYLLVQAYAWVLSRGTWNPVPDNAAGLGETLLPPFLSVSLQVPKKCFQELQLVGNSKRPAESIFCLEWRINLKKQIVPLIWS